jgi:tetratricopeptide (TPR) repeat protein
LGIDEALRYANELETDEVWVIAAWDVRRAYYLRQGDWREAERCRDRIERLRVQSVRRPPMVDTSARLELDTSAHAGDLLGVRRAMARMESMIALHPGYAVYAHFGPAMIEHLKGNNEAALQHLERALAMVRPGRHPTWAWIAGSRIEVLIALGRYREAEQAGLAYVKEGTAAGLRVMLDHITVALALAQAKLGDFDSAIEHLDHAVEYRESMGSAGLNLGWAYEVRARVAIWMRDQRAFTRAAAACAREYGYGRGGTTFGPKYEALRAEARQAGLHSASELPPAPDEDAPSTYLSTLSGNTAIEDRLVLALELLATAIGARGGVLYRAQPGARAKSSMTLERCASTVQGEVPSQATAWVSSVLATNLSEDDETQSLTMETPGLRIGDTGHWLPFAIGCRRQGRYEQTGAALMWFDESVTPKLPNAELLEVVGHLLAS